MLDTIEKQSTSGTVNRAGSANEYLTFRLGKEEYGTDILKVQEIRGYDAVTAIANASAFIKGVINLRGIIVPIVDRRIKFNVGKAHYDQFTVVIILNIAQRVVGIVVDSVSDVLTLQVAQIKRAPEFATTLNTEYILGLGTVDERMPIMVHTFSASCGHPSLVPNAVPPRPRHRSRSFDSTEEVGIPCNRKSHCQGHRARGPGVSAYRDTTDG